MSQILFGRSRVLRYYEHLHGMMAVGGVDHVTTCAADHELNDQERCQTLQLALTIRYPFHTALIWIVTLCLRSNTQAFRTIGASDPGQLHPMMCGFRSSTNSQPLFSAIVPPCILTHVHRSGAEHGAELAENRRSESGAVNKRRGAGVS